ncbi:MAG: CapA family protein [Erysipelotrichaceae bacterium]|nr:CapA family protein [Erysipelotrichaceae bacterium]
MSNSNSILIAGDFFPTKRNHEQFESAALNELMDEVLVDLFQNAAFSICNLEGVFTDKTTPVNKVDSIIRANPSEINAYKKLGISCVTLANNHSGDYGPDALQETITVLTNNGISCFGASATGKEDIQKEYRVEINGKKIVFYNVAETMFNTGRQKVFVNLYDEYRVCKELQEIKKDCDYLIVLYHGGMEFYWYVTPELKKRFHRMADSGADMVLAQHTHCITAKENYNGSYLLYGQGDFHFALGNMDRLYKKYGLLLELVVGDTIEVTEHLVCHPESRATCVSMSEFEDYEKRNQRMINGDTFEEEFKEYSRDRMMKWMHAFRGEASVKDKLQKKVLSEKEYDEYIRSLYDNKQILRMISGIEFEEFREMLIEGLWNMIDD